MTGTNLPFVSIVITNFNNSQYLKSCLLSLGSVDYPRENMEIIVVDDASSDSSVDMVRRMFPSVKIICNKTTKGPAESKNIGAKLAKFGLIAFLDNDVEVEKTWLMPLVGIIDNNKKIAICCSKVLFLEDRKQINSAGGVVNIYGDGWGRGIFEQDTCQYDGEEKVFYGCSAAMLTRKDIIDEVGYFDKDYFYLYEDLDYGWRVNLAGYRAAYVPESVAYHKFGATMKRGTFSVRYFTERNRIQTILKNYDTKTLVKILPGFLKIRAYKTVNTLDSAKKMRLSCFISFLLAWLWNIANLPKTLKKRNAVQTARKISDEEIFNLMGDYKLKIFMR